MTPRTFVKLAIAAAATSFAAIAVYAANAPWSEAKVTGAKLAPALSGGSTKIGSIAIAQGGNTLTLVPGKDNRWTIKERADYPADAEPIRALLVSLAQAERLESKTRNPERYGVLELEPPAAKDAKSKGVRVLDPAGKPLADIVFGKKKAEAFGSGKGGTYVRVDKDPQVWLVNAELDASADVKRWIKPGIFETDGAKLADVKIEVAGEDALEITRVDGKLVFKGLPGEGKKLKDPSAADSLARAVAQLEADDVRKLDQAAVAAPGPSVVTLKGDKGLQVTLRVRREADAAWISVAAVGEGDAKAAADAITAKSKGWEFKVPATKADAFLKKRADLIE
jgi:hypothetical protein